MADERPGDGAELGVVVRAAVSAFERADDEEEAHHAEGAKEEGWPTAPAVEEEDRGQGEGHVEDVLNRGGQEWVTDSGGLHHVHLF